MYGPPFCSIVLEKIDLEASYPGPRLSLRSKDAYREAAKLCAKQAANMHRDVVRKSWALNK